MAKETLRYEKMVDDALRGVLREALAFTAQHGLPGQHHFYITFRTNAPGVEVSDQVSTRYPDEMTIVLQHQYWGLEVTPDAFAVTLSFNRANERLHIPFSAVTAFADPSAKFGLQFQTKLVDASPAPPPVAATAASPEPAAPAGDTGQVITLDAFRKK